MEAFLQEILPRGVGKLSFKIHPHQGKQDLLANLPSRLRGYRSWLPSNWRIVVILDCDDDDCLKLKRRLEQMAREADLTTKSSFKTLSYELVNRLAIEELEAWYFGDWDAVHAAYPRVRISRKERNRNTDSIRGTWETFERVLQKAGYFKGGLRKIEAARTIARHMDPDKNTSRSFQVFCKVLREIASS